MIAVTLKGLTKRFGDFLALDGIDLRIEPGELFLLLGPSGCGKTTLLRHVAGFSFPDKGSVLFDHEDVTRMPPHRRNVGMMFQSYALWPHMTVGENVAFGLQERRVPSAEIKTRVADALESVRMAPCADRKIHQISGGQQQRVALARALVVRPRCLLLDEPLSNLDAKLRLEMRQEIRRVCKEYGLTTIYVTHDQKEALAIADRLAILDKGRIAQAGTPREVYRRPRSRAVADFMGEAGFFQGMVKDLASASDSLPSDHVSVSTSFGIFTGVKAHDAWQPAPGEKVSVCIRPECWKLHDLNAENPVKSRMPGGTGAPAERGGYNADSRGNEIPGKIGPGIYLGEMAQYDFHPRDGGAPLKVLELNPRSLEKFGRDSEIVARVAPEDVIVLRE